MVEWFFCKSAEIVGSSWKRRIILQTDFHLIHVLLFENGQYSNSMLKPTALVRLDVCSVPNSDFWFRTTVHQLQGHARQILHIHWLIFEIKNQTKMSAIRFGSRLHNGRGKIRNRKMTWHKRNEIPNCCTPLLEITSPVSQQQWTRVDSNAVWSIAHPWYELGLQR